MHAVLESILSKFIFELAVASRRYAVAKRCGQPALGKESLFPSRMNLRHTSPLLVLFKPRQLSSTQLGRASLTASIADAVVEY
jgi:hypothetical protein